MIFNLPLSFNSPQETESTMLNPSGVKLKGILTQAYFLRKCEGKQFFYETSSLVKIVAAFKFLTGLQLH